MATEFLFSYGTLQLEAVQLANFGRPLTGKPDVLLGYNEAIVEIDDEATVSLSGKTHHPIAQFTGNTADMISGTVYALSKEELQSADSYEVSPYQRVAVVLQSGVHAWVYVDGRCAPQKS